MSSSKPFKQGEIKEEEDEKLREYTWDEIRKHNTEEDLWVVIHGRVFDVTDWQIDHPGGPDVLQDIAAQDATQEFESIMHTQKARTMAKAHLIGKVKDAKLITGSMKGSQGASSLSKAEEAKVNDNANKKQEETKEQSKDLVDGFYTDPFHILNDGTFAGTRTISDHDGNITVIGTDDGVKWWKLDGKWTNKEKGELQVDFTQKGAPEKYKDFPGTYSNGKIVWKDASNTWTKVTAWNAPK